jgi:hypothetical protein
MRRALVAIVAAAFLFVGAFVFGGCDPDKPPPKNPRAPVCPPPPEPSLQSVVVGTIGRLHMAESRYPISRLGDVMASFKPDVVLLAMRVEPFHDGKYEDASFEMTYVATIAKSRAVPVEAIDWFREEDLGAALPSVDPSDEVEIARREAEVLLRPKLYTFEQANGDELAAKIFLATNAEARHRAGNAAATRRTAWMQHLATDAVARHGRPRKVLAFVDVFDRPGVDLALRAVGYEPRDPVAIVSASSEVMAADLPPELFAQYKAQLARVRDRVEKTTGEERAFWQDRARVLDVVVEKRAACCVTQSALSAPP